MGFDEFLKEVAPLFGLQWRPFQRRGVKRKIERRIIESGLSHFDEYLLKVQKDPEEQRYLSKILTVTISRFYRDKEVFNLLENSIIHEEPFSGMDIVFCRNLAFTYFSKECQMDVLKKIARSLNEGGYLVIGKDESLPLTYPTLFVSIFPTERVYQKFNPK